MQKEARPISLRQLTFFGRALTENRLLSSANYVRTELPTRLAHRLRDMQTLPYVVVANPHIAHVYELYYKAFEALRKVSEIKTLDENEAYCKVVSENLREHLTVIPRLAMGVLECQGLMPQDAMDKFMNTLLRARISRRVIAEQHLALTETFQAPWHFPDAMDSTDPNTELIGEVFLRCKAKDVLEDCWTRATETVTESHGSQCRFPKLALHGHVGATFPYILSHLQYIVGELLRNSIQAVVENTTPGAEPPPIEMLVCEAPQHVIFRISDQGGGIPRETMPDLWSFSKSVRIQTRLENLSRVPRMAATMQELETPLSSDQNDPSTEDRVDGSLKQLTSRPPNLRLGIGLPMSRVYAEYWAGSLEIHNLEGYGVDTFLQLPKLGNKNEQLTTRASMDAI